MHDAAATEDGSPSGFKAFTIEAILCGDFNLDAGEAGYAAITQTGPRGTLHDAWHVAHGISPQPPTFCVHEQTYLPRPVACDFVFVSEGLRDRVTAVRVDGATRSSDHQPVLLELR